MGDCHCSNIAIMQLFHELKQQFPALPDHVVSQCIAQNSHDKDVCAASLRETQKLTRPFFGSFPPNTTTSPIVGISSNPIDLNSSKVQQRPVSLDVSPLSASLPPQQCQTYFHKRRFLPPLPPLISSLDTSPSTSSGIRVQAPSSAPPISHFTRDFFPNTPSSRGVSISSPITPEKRTCNDVKNNINVLTPTSGFKLNVNVACSPATDNRDFVQTENPFKHTSINSDKFLGSNNINESSYVPIDLHTRSYTSVSLTLRPPSSEPQPPIDIRSKGSSLTYSTSSSDPRGFQSRLQISIGPTSENLGSVSAARIRPSTMSHSKQPNNVTSMGSIPHNNLQRSSGLSNFSAGLQHESTIMNPSQHSSSAATKIIPTQSDCSSNDQNFPITPSIAQPKFSLSLNTSINKEPPISSPSKQPVIDVNLLTLNNVPKHQKQLVTEQYIRKEKLAKELKIEKGKLAAMKKELETLSKPRDPLVSLQELGKRLRSEIYQLRLECNLLADEVDQRSDPTVPFGETNEEFYQGIYTGQVLNLPAFTTSSTLPPPLPSVPPALEPDRNDNHYVDNDNNKDGPSWICEMCTFDNHPLMDTCEQCDMPRFPSLEAQGETRDIHIRVTHHHNFSPRIN
ncbi:TGF-beta-activated kinase 1 and MAP3K7-binding protein 2 isoform X3 [Chelonus insularis]|uniref:TGF-beta-activated kinase 1 and MAP3K7-binding protein 2 isoform X3 n=1 Tax=Chelonus insularis TaxID=460826 RepID=UPI00158E8EF1|nr:TGF-beta-activated kinase 1 and MAP3K7-binding protein 2 isoform X3 [Chelonus insularis]